MSRKRAKSYMIVGKKGRRNIFPGDFYPSKATAKRDLRWAKTGARAQRSSGAKRRYKSYCKARIVRTRRHPTIRK